MSHHVLMQTAKCIAASAVDFIKTGRTIPGVRIEGPWDPVLGGQDVERVLTDINADYGDCGIELLRHGVLLVFGAPGQLKMLAGQEHGRTIPLADSPRPT